jgi:hypothetical protein
MGVSAASLHDASGSMASGDAASGPDPEVGEVAFSRHFEVHEGRLADLVASVEALARRARRLGVDGPRIVVGGSFMRAFEDEWTGERAYHPMVHVDVSGASPRIAGWTFAGTVDHDGEESIVRAIDPSLPAAYRDAGPTCEHCNLRRRRNETFILRHEGGDWKQVGRSCLRDFLGYGSPERHAALAEHLAEAMAGAEASSGGPGSRSEPSVESYLAFVACAVRRDGWLSRSAAREGGRTPTADLAARWMGKPRPGESHPRPTDEDRAVAEEAIAWARAIGDDASDFDRNLRAASKRVSVADRNMGITAYIVPGFLRDSAREAERSRCGGSAWVGAVGSSFGPGPGRSPALRLLCEQVRAFGATWLHLFSDSDGNFVKWFSRRERLEVGTTYSVAGTVRGHEVYRGVKETVLSWCDARELDADGNLLAELVCPRCGYVTCKLGVVPGRSYPCPDGDGEMVPTWD